MAAKQPTFFEADAAIRTTGNRALVVAGLALVVALGSVGGFLFADLRLPVVIRVLPNGTSQVITPHSRLVDNAVPAVLQNLQASEAPTADEKENYVRTFVTNYMNYDVNSLASNWATALNMMSSNLRSAALAEFRKDNTVGRLEHENVRSSLTIKSVEIDPTNPFVYHVYGVRTVDKTIHNDAQEVQLVEAYQVTLATTKRTVDDPSGLLIADFSIQQISSDDHPAQFSAPVAKLTGAQ
jgi:hypothetical protein